jgi:hypothetical protein
LTNSDTTQILGGPTDKWGKTWTVADFADATFKIKVGTAYASGNAWLDSVGVKVYYTVLENSVARCTDQIDNDNDGQTDFADSDCAQFKPVITVNKEVVNDDGGTLEADDFTLRVGNTEVTRGQATAFNPGTYTVNELETAGYFATYSGDCDSSGTLTMAAGGSYTCTVTNNDLAPKITVTKVVEGGDKQVSDFNLYVGDTQVTSGVEIEMNAGIYTVREEGFGNYLPSFSGDCDEEGDITLEVGEEYSCTITNTYIPQCSDMMDNDQDGNMDEADRGCSSGTDDNESDDPAYACFNGADDDQDGFTDMNDPGCESQTDDDEYNDPTPTPTGTPTATPTPTPKTATIIATKVVCEDESMLPNWGNSGSSKQIKKKTASDWIKNHKGCSLAEGWNFQWAPGGTENPGDETGEAGSPWMTFGPTNSNGIAQTVVTLGDLKQIRVREILKEGYIQFTGANTNQNVSAEMYCHTDVYKYDNFDFIDDPKKGRIYYCVAFNAPVTQEPSPSPMPSESPTPTPTFTPTPTPTESCLVFEACVDGRDSVKVQNNLLSMNHYDFDPIGTHGGCPSDMRNIIKVNGVSHEVVWDGQYYIDGNTTLGVDVANLESAEKVLGRGSVSQDGLTAYIDDNDYGGSEVYKINICGVQTTPTPTPTPTPTGEITVCKYNYGEMIASEESLWDKIWATVVKTAQAVMYLGQPMGGWTVAVDELQLSGVTNGEDGCYTFEGIPYGTYTVSEEDRCGWTQVYPGGETDNVHIVTLDGEDPSAWVYFQNDENEEQCVSPSPNPTPTPTDTPNPTPEPTPVPSPTPNGGGANGPLGFGGNFPPAFPLGGSVLGASTGPGGGQVLGESCGIYLNDFLKMGKKNNPEQVKKLQMFLNKYMGANLPVTGYFGPMTKKAVEDFQLKYWQAVLSPWVKYGLPNGQTPTGYVYKTTQYMINLINCFNLNTPWPQLP